jgi:glycosyltransferase involved in cell wall biosynthesis
VRVAIIHPWFLARGGGERTVEIMAEMFPLADIFTLFCDRQVLPPSLKGRRIISSGWNWLPYKYSLYRYLFPLYPRAVEALDLRGYDLVLSSDSCIAKGVLLDDETTHVCYCHSPMRCLYDQYRQTLEELPWFGRPVFRLAAHYLRMWDHAAAYRVTGIAANSRYISRRIRTYYGLGSKVVYPPVETRHGYIDSSNDDYYLCVGRLVKAKRVEIAIRACNTLQRRLVVVGCGRELADLKRIAGPTIEFTEWASPEQLASLYARCRALLFAARVDVGMVPGECQS